MRRSASEARPDREQADARSAAPPPPATWEHIVGSIGMKVHELRQQMGFSLQQLAARSSVSAAAIHKVERNDMVPTITTLLKLATALGKPVGYFVDEPTDGVRIATYTPAADRPPLPSGGSGIELAGIAGPAHRFRAAGALACIAPGAGSGDNRPLRAGEDLVLMLEGVLDFEVANEQYALRAGDSLHYPTDRRHRWVNPGDEPARAVWFSLRAD